MSFIEKSNSIDAIYIEIEGVDGAGKTTQCFQLEKYFQSLNQRSIIVKELSSTSFGQSVRGLLASETAGVPRAEMFLFLACKSQVHQKLILPSLEANVNVISDRGSGSFISYNSSILGMSVDLLKQLNGLCTARPPDLTILLDVDPQTSQDRCQLKNEVSRFDCMSLEILESQRSKFLELAKFSDDWLVLDGTEPVESIAEKIFSRVGAVQQAICSRTK